MDSGALFFPTLVRLCLIRNLQSLVDGDSHGCEGSWSNLEGSTFLKGLLLAAALHLQESSGNSFLLIPRANSWGNFQGVKVECRSSAVADFTIRSSPINAQGLTVYDKDTEGLDLCPTTSRPTLSTAYSSWFWGFQAGRVEQRNENKNSHYLGVSKLSNS